MAVQTELHRHLDVSLRPETFLRLAQERGLEAESTSLEAFKEKILIKSPMTDLNAVLLEFQLVQSVLDRPDVLEQIAFEVVEDCYREGTRKVELRYSPEFACEKSRLKWEDSLDGFEAGVKRAIARYPDMKAGLICIASREYGLESAEKTVEFFLKFQERFVGLDLAGNEADHPARLFRHSFQKAKDRGARLTIHAGEASGPDMIWEAIQDLGAERIGHGISCVKDPELMRYLAEKQICLEMCPTSNWLTQAVPSFAEHPLPTVLRAGIPVCINTDDPALFGASLVDEIAICREKMGMSAAEIASCFAHADRASFILS